jgi:excisionase family DNA binding protein
MKRAMNLPEKIETMGRALTADDLAQLLSVSKVQVYKLASARTIPSFRVGLCLRFDPHSVAAWLRGRVA